MLNPGSAEAKQEGCTCPSEPNQDGQGVINNVHAEPSKTFFLVEEDCPLHGQPMWREK